MSIIRVGFLVNVNYRASSFHLGPKLGSGQCQLSRRWKMCGKSPHSQGTARISMLRSEGQFPNKIFTNLPFKLFVWFHDITVWYFCCRFFKDFRPFFFLCQLTGMFPYKLQWNLPFSWYLISFEKTFENTQWRKKLIKCNQCKMQSI